MNTSTSAFLEKRLEESLEPLFSSSGAMALRFGEGIELRIEDFLSLLWGRLKDWAKNFRRVLRQSIEPRQVRLVGFTPAAWLESSPGRSEMLWALQYDLVSPACGHIWPAFRHKKVVQRLRHRSQLPFLHATFALIATRCRGLDCFLAWGLCGACGLGGEEGLLTLYEDPRNCNKFPLKQPGSRCLWRVSSHKLLSQSQWQPPCSCFAEWAALNWFGWWFHIPPHSFGDVTDSSGVFGPLAQLMGLETWPNPTRCGKGEQFVFKNWLPEYRKMQETSTVMLFQAAVNLDWDVTIQCGALSINIECWKIKTREKSQGQ